jgi:hypothetical protein
MTNIQKTIRFENKKIEKLSDLIRSAISIKLDLQLPDDNRNFFLQTSGQSDERLDYYWKRPLTEEIKQYLLSKKAINLDSLLEQNFDYGVNAYGVEKGKIPFINVENLTKDGKVDSIGIRYLNNVQNSKIVRENDILISRSRTVGVCSLVSKKEIGSTFGSYILRFRVKTSSGFEPKFIVNYLNSELGQSQIRYLQTGSREVVQGGGNNINPDQLRQTLIVKPKETEMKFIVEKVEKLLEQKKKEQEKLEILISNYENYFENYFTKIQKREN